jgi:thioredoxin reductase
VTVRIPTELLSVAKEQLAKYGTVRYVVGSATDVAIEGSGFGVGLADGTRLSAARVLIATGYGDDLARLGLPGVQDVYGKSVFPRPFCDGFEHGDERLAVFGGDGVEHFVPVVRVWSDDLVVFTNGHPLGGEATETLEQRGVRVVQESVKRLSSSDGALQAVELETGEAIERQAGFIADDFSFPATGFARDLGVGTTKNEWGMDVPDVDGSGKSNVPGVYVIGDARTGFSGLIAAANEGAGCVEGIVHDLASERWQQLT